MKISELAKKANCDIETIRHYEKVGLLGGASPPRQWIPGILQPTFGTFAIHPPLPLFTDGVA
jgi:hypothetical protein